MRARGLLRSTLVRALLGTATTTTCSCVVNPAPTPFQDPTQCPPYFVPDQADPHINKFKIIDPSTGTAQFQASVPIKSCALSKQFIGRVFVDGNHSSFIQETVFQPTGTDTRSAIISVPISGSETLTEGCHIIELLASSAFAPGEVRQPAQSGDLAYVVWFVYVHATKPGVTDTTIPECPQP